MSDVQELFYQYFDVLLADEPGILDEALKLRYQVYCIENKLESAAEFKDGKESDCFDRRSAHSVVRHNATGLTAATVRLVLSDPQSPEAPFPIEMNCAASLKPNPLQAQGIPRSCIAEISRFAVSREFKRRLGEQGTVHGIVPEEDSCTNSGIKNRRVLPHLVLGLFTAIVKMSAKNNVTYWYAVMDRSLLRLLSRFGIEFITIGGLVDYHGMRQPCYGNVDTVLEGIWKKHPDIWQLITASGTVWPAPDMRLRQKTSTSH